MEAVQRMSEKWRNYFGAKEWEVITKLISSFDAEQKKAFVYSCREKKELNALYSIFDDFPDMRGEETKTELAMRECCEFVRGLSRLPDNE